MQQKNQETITQTASLLHKRGRGAVTQAVRRGGGRDRGGRGLSIDARPFTRLQCASPPHAACTHPPLFHAALVPQPASGRSLLGKNGEMTSDIRVLVSGRVCNFLSVYLFQFSPIFLRGCCVPNKNSMKLYIAYDSWLLNKYDMPIYYYLGHT